MSSQEKKERKFKPNRTALILFITAVFVGSGIEIYNAVVEEIDFVSIINTKNKEIKELESRLEATKKEADGTKAKLKASHGQERQLQATSESQKGEINNLTAQREELGKELQTLGGVENELKKSQKQVEELEKEKASQQKMITELKSEVDSLNRNIKALKDENKKLGAEMIRHATLRANQQKKNQPASEAFFFEDFKNREIENYATKWGDNIAIKEYKGSNAVCCSPEASPANLTKWLKFPTSFEFSFDYYSTKDQPYLIKFYDTNDKDFTISWGNCKDAGMTINNHEKAKYEGDCYEYIKFKLVRIGSTYMVYINETSVFTGNFTEYEAFRKFTIDIQGKQAVTNFKGTVIGDYDTGS